MTNAIKITKKTKMKSRSCAHINISILLTFTEQCYDNRFIELMSIDQLSDSDTHKLLYKLEGNADYLRVASQVWH